MAVLTVQTLVPATGITPTFTAAAAGGDSVSANGRVFLVVKNGGAGSVTVTATSTATVAGLAVADPTFAVAAGAEKWLGPFDGSVFGNASGNVDITYSGVTTVTVGAFTA